MALLTAGYWQTTYWAENYWNPRYWPAYGTAAPPTPAVPTGTRRTLTWPPTRTKEDLLRPEKPKIEVIPQPLIEGMTFEELVRYAMEMLAPIEATEEDFRRILEPLIPPKKEDDTKQIEKTLRQLLGSFKTNGELFENGLREILRNKKLKEKN